MARLIECDGCGKRTHDLEKSPSHRIIRMKFSAAVAGYSPDALADTVGWEADLCRSCLKNLPDPKTWARAEPEAPR